METVVNIEHILMCEDDKDHAYLFENFLKKEYPNIRLSILSSGEEVIPFLHLYRIDLIFLDLHLPCKDGFDCLRDIKNDSLVKEIPVIVYSSSAHLTDIQKSFICQADFYLVKPFKTEHLRTAMEIILSVNWKDNPPIKHHYFINNRFVPYTSVA